MANISFLMLRVESVMAPRITPTHIWPKKEEGKTKKSILTYYRCITDSNLTLAILIIHIHVWDNILTSMKATIFSRFLKTWWCVNQILQINIDWSWFNAISGIWFYLIFISILDAISLWVCFLSMLNVIWYQKGQYISLLYTVDYLPFESSLCLPVTMKNYHLSQKLKLLIILTKYMFADTQAIYTLISLYSERLIKGST